MAPPPAWTISAGLYANCMATSARGMHAIAELDPCPLDGSVVECAAPRFGITKAQLYDTARTNARRRPAASRGRRILFHTRSRRRGDGATIGSTRLLIPNQIRGSLGARHKPSSTVSGDGDPRRLGRRPVSSKGTPTGYCSTRTLIFPPQRGPTARWHRESRHHIADHGQGEEGGPWLSA